jgi:hypothetical protein
MVTEMQRVHCATQLTTKKVDAKQYFKMLTSRFLKLATCANNCSFVLGMCVSAAGLLQLLEGSRCPWFHCVQEKVC